MNLFKKIATLTSAALIFSCSYAGLEKGTETQLSGMKTGYTYIAGNLEKISYETVDGINLFEGDIAIRDQDIFATRSEGETRAAVTNARLWPNNTVPFQIASTAYNKHYIIEAIERLGRKTNLRFVEVYDTTTTTDYLYIRPSGGSWSYVGYIGGKQELGLASWATVGTAVHEIMHAVGVYHEHSRKDRDNHVTVHYENIEAGMEGNFRKISGTHDYDIGVFDFDSIMIYSSMAFSTNGKPTITKKDGTTFNSQRELMSPVDIQGLNFLYPDTGMGDTEAPSSPKGITKGTITSLSIGISWTPSTDNTGVTGYKVFVNDQFEMDVNGTSAVIEGLSVNTEYKISLAAFDAAGNISVRCENVKIRTDYRSPGQGYPWAAGTYYVTGDEVTYNGSTWVCTMSHSAMAGWEPGPNAAALWKLK